MIDGPALTPLKAVASWGSSGCPSRFAPPTRETASCDKKAGPTPILHPPLGRLPPSVCLRFTPVAAIVGSATNIPHSPAPFHYALSKGYTEDMALTGRITYGTPWTVSQWAVILSSKRSEEVFAVVPAACPPVWCLLNHSTLFWPSFDLVM